MSDGEGAKARTRALYKKGQKCIVQMMEKDPEGNDKIVNYAVEILRGEKRVLEDGDHDYFYHVHFLGWGKAHDQWYVEGDLLKYDKSLLEGGTNEEAEQAAERKKAKAEAESAAAAQLALLKEIPAQLRLRIPAALKKKILEDYSLVVGKGLALPLPRRKHKRPSVTEIIDQWQEAETVKEEADIESITEIAQGLKNYFNKSLRQLLLYQAELPIFDQAVVDAETASANPPAPAATGKGSKKGKKGAKTAETELANISSDPCDLYGAEHLVRLFVKLPELVPVPMMCTHGDARYVLALEGAIHSVMSVLVEEEQALFSTEGDYERNNHWVAPLKKDTRGLELLGSGVGGKKEEDEEEEEEDDGMDEG